MNFNQLGPSKVSMQIKRTPELTQGYGLSPGKKIDINMPLKIRELPVPPLMNDIEKDDGGSYFRMVGSTNNTFLMLCLNVIDDKTSLLKASTACEELAKFKSDLSKNLDNEKHLWKKFGFSRKRTLNLLDLKDFLARDDTDTDLLVAHPELITYISKLLQKNICVVNYGTKSAPVLGRTDFINDPISPWILFKREGTSFWIGSGTGGDTASQQGISDQIEKDLVALGHMATLLATKKALEIKRLVKIIGATMTSKDALLSKYDVV